MNKLKVKASKEMIIEALILSYQEDIFKRDNPSRYTKFDSDNDSFMGSLGEMVLKDFLIEKKYQYGIDFFDTKNLPDNDYYINQERKYDKYDFGIYICNKYYKIDLKTQYCINTNYVNENWQMAVNENTINKIDQKKREIDYFLFIFCDQKTKKLKELVHNKLKEQNISNKLENAIELLENCLRNKTNIFSFDTLELVIVGIISTKKFKILSSKFNLEETFRINYGKNKNVLKWRTDASMYRIYIKYLSHINKVIPPKKYIIPNIDHIKFKEWFENCFEVENSNFSEISISDNIKLKIPYNKIYFNSQYETFEDFFTEAIKYSKSNKNQ